LLFIVPRIDRRLPGGLIVLFGSIAVSSLLDLSGRHGVEIVGELPQGLPRLALPGPPTVGWVELLVPAIGIFFVAYSEALGVAREFAERHGYRVDADQELRAHAGVNLATSVVGGMVASGGMSGTAVNDGGGARTPVSLLVAWGAVVVTLLVLTPLFTTLPEAVLAALIIHAVWHLIAARKLRRFRSLSTVEWTLGAITFLGVILVDVLVGMVIGVTCAIAMEAYRSSRPHLATLGSLPGLPGAYVDLGRHPDARPTPGVLVVRLDAPLYFANALTVEDRLRAVLDATTPSLRALVIDAAVQDAIDITGATAISTMAAELERRRIALFVGDLHAPVRDFLREHGFLVIPADRDFATTGAAVEAAQEYAATPAANDDRQPSPKPGDDVDDRDR